MRVSGNLFFQPKMIFRGPTKGVNTKNSGISKLLKYYVIGTLSLCQEMPGRMHKESAQSDHPIRRKRPKRGRILLIWANSKIAQYFGTFCAFSPSMVVGLSGFLLHWFRHLPIQV